MELSELWFVLVAVLFVGFFFLEGFDFGVGMALPVLGRNDVERRILINTIGPFWDANEVWLLTAGGAIFAAFPHWYATMFSGYYIPFVFVLLALIGRGVAFEFRSKVGHETWRTTWDYIIFFGSLLPPFLFGVLFSTILRGMPIDETMTLRASFSDYVNPYSVVGGVAVTLMCLYHGLLFLTLRTVGDLQQRAKRYAQRVWLPLVLVLAGFVAYSAVETDLLTYRGSWTMPMLGAVVVFYGLSLVFSRNGRDGFAFAFSGFGIIGTVAAIFVGLFPRVMISTLGHDLTVYNAASSPYSLKVMTIVAVTLLPFVLGYQIWSYIVFRKRVDGKGMIY